MKLQRSPEAGLCLLTSFAMVLDMNVEDLQRDIGVIWKSRIFPELAEPYCWRGYHIQELIRYAVQRGFSVTPIELAPVTGSPLQDDENSVLPSSIVPLYRDPESLAQTWRLFNTTIRNTRGVLTGTLTRTTAIVRNHAMAYSYGTVYDPSGAEFQYSASMCEDLNFYANCAWRVDQMES